MNREINGRTAIFVSPHLDDVAFSCGGTLAKLHVSGWRCVVVTCFTRSVLNPGGFALECQLDKGLTPDVDYMELRRAEDVEFCRRVGEEVRVVHLDLPEAPHREYGSAASLFAGIAVGDAVWFDLAEDLAFLLASEKPEVIFAPQGLGNHADHLQAIKALEKVLEIEEDHPVPLPTFPTPKVLRYRDTPYAMLADAPIIPYGTSELSEIAYQLEPEHLEVKLHATEAYTTQLGFQFGDALNMRESLTEFARSEAKRTGTGEYAEAFLSRMRG